MRNQSGAVLRCLTAILGVLMAPVAYADLYGAVAAYEKKDHARAFELFRELAELGHPLAQETLAIMYVMGEGVKRDNVAGYAWAQIAKETDPRAKVQPIIDQLEKSLSPDARARVAEIRSKFGRKALEAWLLPLPRDAADEEKAGSLSEPAEPTCRMTEAANSSSTYPLEAIRAGVSGSVFIKTTVLADGRARNPRPLLSLPPNGFELSGRTMAFQSKFKAPQVDGVTVPCTITFWHRFYLQSSDTEQVLKAELKKLKADVTARDPMAQMQYALLKTGWPNLNREKENIAPLLIEAAQAGLPTAQFSVGFYTLGGLSVVRDRAKGLRWLEMAANKGHHDAAVMLATELLRKSPDSSDVARARTLLETAAAGDSMSAKYFLADLLLEAGSAPADPRRSLELLGDVMKYLQEDPSAFEVRAAALSQRGDFEAAIAAQKRALAKARKLHWDVAPQVERLALYSNSQPWTRRLLDY
jgi:TPR repeat protein